MIVGAGIVGLTSALAIANKTSLRIALVESKPFSAVWEKEKYADRVSAISKASENIFKNLQSFASMRAKRISPYQKMHVWDAEGTGEIHFAADLMHEDTLGFIIEDNVMRASLFEKIQENPLIEILSGHLHALHKKENHVELIYLNEEVLKTKLVIGADGAQSWVRETLQIPLKNYDYEQTAIVCNVETEKPHEKTARQIFLKEGPLAFLPLHSPHDCSIVWSAKHEYAKQLLALNATEFAEKLSDAFQYTLGKVTLMSSLKHFPLRMRHVNHYVQDRIALVGDAAHTIHPMVGQGVNLGLLDAVTLAEVITDAFQKNRDFGSFQTLRRYERFRKSETVTMIAMIDVLKHLFSSETKSVKQLRSMGLNFTNRTPWLKNFFAKYALGKRDELPPLAR